MSRRREFLAKITQSSVLAFLPFPALCYNRGTRNGTIPLALALAFELVLVLKFEIVLE